MTKGTTERKPLLIVESPAKARTLKRILGESYDVLSSNGHVRDLPEKKLGVDTKNGFTPTYVLIPSKNEVVKKLKTAASKAKEIILGTDPDREGEAIAWHLSQILDKDVKRVEFFEITKDKVIEALKHPRRINQLRVNSQIARRVLDRLVGYSLSPVLWNKIKRGLSAGRVQSVAVRLICEREEEIRSFTPREYWLILGSFQAGDISFEAEFVAFNGTKISRPEDEGSKGARVISSEEEARAIEEILRRMDYLISSVEVKEVKRQPQPPFITATLQQEAFKKLGFHSSRTMQIAQELYEGIDVNGERMGVITYMRTDSVRIEEDFLAKTRSYILKNYGERYVPATPRKYKSSPRAQEAHEAIRPTNLDLKPEDLKGKVNDTHFKLYDLIFRRYLASQMADALYQQRTVHISGEEKENSALFRQTVRTLKFDGFLAASLPIESEENNNGNADSKQKQSAEVLPLLVEGTTANLIDLHLQQSFTKPPAKYTEASLIKALEEKGIGRPSTYSVIIETIIRRGYITRDKGRLVPTQWAFVTNQLLNDYFPEVVDVNFTAKMEDGLDEIEEGKNQWQELIGSYYFPLNEKIQSALKDDVRYKVIWQKISEKCPECGSPLEIRYGRFGKFVSCSNFPACHYVKKENEAIKTDRKCPKCGSQVVVRRNRWGIQFASCSAYPKCDFVGEVHEFCPKCGAKLLKRRMKNRKVFYVCKRNNESKKNKCDFIVFGYPTLSVCSLCGSFLAEVRRSGRLHVICANSSCANHRGIESQEEIVEEKDNS